MERWKWRELGRQGEVDGGLPTSEGGDGWRKQGDQGGTGKVLATKEEREERGEVAAARMRGRR
ncbi:UNVERIFIED_CONTAM: hypothetical protein Sradi_0092700 [Sesamum radiatum]|uniref:Uncharacterized protein n=1 Tax=Sesamum radiatum TaxID=300843 RepID=A0AAW2WJ74_SESRA